MGTHTPGPWLAEESFLNKGFYSIYSVPLGVGDGDIVYLSGSLRSADNEANARLIAAAPESHAANLATVTALDEAFGIKAVWDDERIYDELPSSGVARAYFMARAAIAKATGGTP